MKFIKALIMVGSAIGVYSIVKKYKTKQKSAEVKQPPPANMQRINKYKQLTPGKVREQFKERIAAGDWPSKDEYADMADAMKILAAKD